MVCPAARQDLRVTVDSSVVVTRLTNNREIARRRYRGYSMPYSQYGRTTGRSWRPQGDSNPRYRRERAMSWASRRWGRGNEFWWSQAGSNRRPLACHASALPAELWPHAGAATYG